MGLQEMTLRMGAKVTLPPSRNADAHAENGQRQEGGHHQEYRAFGFRHVFFPSGFSGLICSARNTRSATMPVRLPTAAPTPIRTGR